MIRFMCEEFSRSFQHEDIEIEVPAVSTMNVPFNGGYITRRMGNRGIPFVQIEMSRALYLQKRYFNEKSLDIEDRRLRDLNGKVWQVLKKVAPNL
jgi:N-formylglutamate amidohydrolase